MTLKKMRLFLITALLCLALPVLAAPPAALKPQAKVGTRAPDFSLRDLNSNLIRLSDLAYPGDEKSWKKKKQVLIDFFRTDCKPCMKELPQVLAYYEKHKDKVQVIMIALLESENGRDKLDKFLKAHNFEFPVLVDAYETVAKKYIVDGETVTLPSIFFIDRNGMVRARFVGLEENLENSLNKALGG